MMHFKTLIKKILVVNYDSEYAYARLPSLFLKSAMPERLQEGYNTKGNHPSDIKKMLFHKGFQHNIMNIQTRF